MWKEGSIKVNGDIFHYWMKQYDKGSEWGIDGGRISKKMRPVRTAKFLRPDRTAPGHCVELQYIAELQV